MVTDNLFSDCFNIENMLNAVRRQQNKFGKFHFTCVYIKLYLHLMGQSVKILCDGLYKWSLTIVYYWPACYSRNCKYKYLTLNHFC